MLAGIRRVLYIRTMNTIPLLAILVCYPLVYYIAHAGTEYRHPVDPIVVIFIGLLIAGGQRSRPEQAKSRPPVKALAHIYVPNRSSRERAGNIR